MAVRALFRVSQITEYESGFGRTGKMITFLPDHKRYPTPAPVVDGKVMLYPDSGQIQMSFSDLTLASGFAVGQKLFIDFIPCDD